MTHADISTSVRYTHQTGANEQSAPDPGTYVLAGIDYRYQALKEPTEHTSPIEPIVNEELVYANLHEAAPAESSSVSHDTEIQYANPSTPSYRVSNCFVWLTHINGIDKDLCMCSIHSVCFSHLFYHCS